MQMIKAEFQDGRLVVFIQRDIDHHNATTLRQEIDQEIGNFRPKLVILNFEAVEFMDSSGIGLIMGRYKLMQQANGELQIAALKPRLQKLVEISGVKQIVKII